MGRWVNIGNAPSCGGAGFAGAGFTVTVFLAAPFLAKGLATTFFAATFFFGAAFFTVFFTLALAVFLAALAGVFFLAISIKKSCAKLNRCVGNKKCYPINSQTTKAAITSIFRLFSSKAYR
jgi:hypothetical protein